MICASLLSDIMGMVSGRAVRLIRPLAFFVNYNKSYIFNRSKNGTPCTDYDVRIAPFYSFVFVKSLTEGKTAVNNSYPVSEKGPEPLQNLRSKSDFGDKEYSTPSEIDSIMNKLFKNRCLAASRNSVKQKYRRFSFGNP